MILTLNSIIQLARRHYMWWRNAKRRMETSFVSMRKLTIDWYCENGALCGAALMLTFSET